MQTAACNTHKNLKVQVKLHYCEQLSLICMVSMSPSALLTQAELRFTLCSEDVRLSSTSQDSNGCFALLLGPATQHVHNRRRVNVHFCLTPTIQEIYQISNLKQQDARQETRFLRGRRRAIRYFVLERLTLEFEVSCPVCGVRSTHQTSTVC